MKLEQGRFDFVKANGIDPGTLCVTPNGTIGWYQDAYLFWHVRGGEMKPDGTFHYLCHCVPYGPHPNARWWFDAVDLTSLGVSWPVPAWNTLERWAAAAYASNPALQPNIFLAGLNKPQPGTRPNWPPYKEEAELVTLLNRIYSDWMTVQHDNHSDVVDRCILPNLIHLADAQDE